MASGPRAVLGYKSVQQLVTERIRAAILDGTLRPSDRLNQVDLAQKFQVSRIPTREALRTLEGEGLVRFYPHRGAVVATMTSREIKDVYEIRSTLEEKAALTAMTQVTREQLAQARKLQAEMVACGDVDRWISLNDQFHLALYHAEGTVWLLKVIEILRNWVAAYIRLIINDEAHRIAANREHLAILRAVEKRNSAALREAIRRHMRTSRDGVVSILQRHEYLQPETEIAARKGHGGHHATS